MKKVNKILIFVLTLMIISLPIFAFALAPWPGLVPCGKGDPSKDSFKPCSFEYVINLINGLINFTFKFLVIPIAAIMFAVAGFKMIASGGASPEARTQAKSVFMNTVIGLIIAAGCFLIIKVILVAVGYKFDNSFWK